MRDTTRKHTLHNVLEVPEVVINIVTRDIVAQANLASCQYDDGTDEFIKAGFTKEKAVKVKPPMVKVAKAKLECNVVEIKPLGARGGAGNLVICEVVYIHIADEVLDEDHAVDPGKLHLAARLGGDYYCGVENDNLFKLPKPGRTAGIGIDSLPRFIRNSNVFTGHDLARLAMIEALDEYDTDCKDERIRSILCHCRHRQELLDKEFCEYAIELLNKNELVKAWQVLCKMQEIKKHGIASITHSF